MSDRIHILLMMPGMDGAHFLKLAREAHAVHAPIVILSGHASVFEKAAALAADGCLKKPISLDELLAAVKKHTEARTKP